MRYRYHIYVGSLIVYSTNSKFSALRSYEALSYIHKSVTLYKNNTIHRIWSRP